MDTLTQKELPWVGILDKRAQRGFKRALIQSTVRAKLNAWAAQLGWKKYKAVHVEDVRIPDSALVKQTLEKMDALCHPILQGHNYRTYFWSAALAKSEGLSFDEERLFVAALLHDIGLTQRHAHVCSETCFAEYGGTAAQRFLQEEGASDSYAQHIAAIIALHLNPEVDIQKYGVEAYSLSKGAAMDVIGIHASQLPATYIAHVLQRFTRTGFTEDIIHTMEAYEHRAGSRAQLLYQMGFAKQAKKNKLDR